MDPYAIAYAISDLAPMVADFGSAAVAVLKEYDPGDVIFLHNMSVFTHTRDYV
jgi:hypothetical protein